MRRKEVRRKKEKDSLRRESWKFSEEVQCANTIERTEEIRKKANHFEWWRKRIARKFFLCFTRFFRSNVLKVNRLKMIYWFVNLNFNLMFSSSARGWRKKVKINQQWAFILHLKNSSFLVVSWKVKKRGVVNSKQHV